MQKRLVLAMSALAVLLPSICNAQAASTPPSNEAPLQAVAERLVVNQQAISRIWPGFWQPPAFAIYLPREVALVYSTTGAPTGFMAVDSASLPSVLRGHWYRLEGAIPGLTGGVRPIDPRARPLALAVSAATRWTSSLAEVVLHENFHGFQVRQFEDEPDSVPFRLTDSDSISVRAQASLAYERLLAIEILGAPDTATLRALARTYLDTRGDRDQTAISRSVEKRQERWEGVATYVGLSGVLAVEDRPRRAFADTLAARIFVDWQWGIGAPNALESLRNRTYQSGALLAFLLDECGCEDWKARVQKGDYLDDLLGACIGKRQ